MSGVISVPGFEPWKVAGWAHRRVLDRAAFTLENPDDIYALERAVALHGLHFHRLDRDQGLRLADVLLKASDGLRPELFGSDDPRDQSLAKYLGVLVDQLQSYIASAKQ